MTGIEYTNKMVADQNLTVAQQVARLNKIKTSGSAVVYSSGHDLIESQIFHINGEIVTFTNYDWAYLWEVVSAD